ncbi:MAG: clan AA aspartic protease [Bacteroidetes bacterium QS_1_65_9]|nr:MAG: clan AA aspartic protease [Bacteroidetes bacterium QS_1_65_9]
MIIGHVGVDGEAIIPLSVKGTANKKRDVDAVLDTGFNGFLALPPRLIEDLQLKHLGQETLVLASGARSYPHKYEATITFGKKLQPVEVIEAGEVLLETRLLLGCDLHIRYVEGGPVELTKVP